MFRENTHKHKMNEGKKNIYKINVVYVTLNFLRFQISKWSLCLVFCKLNNSGANKLPPFNFPQRF